jgi:flavine halogenase
VTELEFSPGSEAPNLRPIACKYTGPSGGPRRITFDYLVDASGRLGVMSTKYLKNRQMNNSLKNIACWGYWTNAGMYNPGTYRENAPWFESLTGSLTPLCKC